tara:strand:- start:598 stop:909 length:312 start_codon:yes stop_codon:yes gene_type:complete
LKVLDLAKVQGNSMLPTLAHGDIVVCCDRGAIKVNDVVIADVLNAGMVVKRIESIIGENIVLRGDNKRLGSSVCGINIPKSSILGRVLLRVTSNLRFSVINRA